MFSFFWILTFSSFAASTTFLPPYFSTNLNTFNTSNSYDYFTSFDDVSTIKYLDGEQTKTLNNIVGVIYDTDTCGITQIQDSVTSQYVGKGDFTNYFHHLAHEYFYDSRLGSVVLSFD